MPERFEWLDDDDAMDDLVLRGVEPYEVRQVLESKPRLRRSLGADVFGLYGRTLAGRYLVVFIAETDDADRWVIYGAREMLPGEVGDFRRRFEPRGNQP